jgi:anti-sigma B factor antagonist
MGQVEPESVADDGARERQSPVPPPGPVVVIEGDFDMASAGAATRALETARREQHGDVTIDLSSVDFIDSSGLKVLLEAHRDLGVEGRKLTLRAPSAAVIRLLQIARVEHVFLESHP